MTGNAYDTDGIMPVTAVTIRYTSNANLIDGNSIGIDTDVMPQPSFLLAANASLRIPDRDSGDIVHGKVERT
jgi:hypothetical protein